MAGAQLALDFRDLPAASFDSRSLLPALGSDLIERAAVAIQRGFLAAESLPALHNDATYFGSNSIPEQTRSVNSAAASVVPEPRKGS